MQNNTTALKRKALNRGKKECILFPERRARFIQFQEDARGFREIIGMGFLGQVYHSNGFNGFSPDGLSAPEKDEKLIETRRIYRDLIGASFSP